MSKFAVGYAMKKKMASGLSDRDPKRKKMSKEESDTLGPVTSRDVAPESGDAFVDGMLKKKMAHGGDVDHEADMVHRILKKCYSEGGQVANGGDDDLSEMADGDPNNFDDLALRDDLESHYTGKNSGDELGNEQEDHDREDIVKRIMKSQGKKDRMPRPA